MTILCDITIITAIIIVIVFFANQRFIKTNYYQNTLRQVNKFVDGVPYELEAVNTGSSYGRYGFEFNETDINGFNFGIQPQSLSYDFKILKHYKDHLNKGCKVIIVLPTLAFGFLDYQDDEINTKYYHFLNKENINGYSKLKYFIRVKYPIISAKLKLRYLLIDQPEIDLYKLKESKLSDCEVEKEVKLRIEGWKKQFKLENMTSAAQLNHLKEMFKKTTCLLSEMITYCIHNELQPILVIPPVSRALNGMISKEFMEVFLYKNIRQANKENIPVLDYLYDERFQDPKLYINADFLNGRGRKLFTKTVMDDLEKKNNIK